MKKSAMTIDQAKNTVSALIGARLKIAVNRGRKKIEKYFGQITGVFPCVFTVNLEGEHPVNTLSFSYADLICGNVRLKSL